MGHNTSKLLAWPFLSVNYIEWTGISTMNASSIGGRHRDWQSADNQSSCKGELAILQPSQYVNFQVEDWIKIFISGTILRRIPSRFCRGFDLRLAACYWPINPARPFLEMAHAGGRPVFCKKDNRYPAIPRFDYHGFNEFIWFQGPHRGQLPARPGVFSRKSADLPPGTRWTHGLSVRLYRYNHRSCGRPRSF